MKLDVRSDILLLGVVFSTPEIAWAFGGLGSDASEGLLLRSGDAGLTWADVSANLPPNAGRIVDVSFADEAIGVLVAGATVFRTDDRGATWVRIESVPEGIVTTYALANRGGVAELVFNQDREVQVRVLQAGTIAPQTLAAPSFIVGGNSVSVFGSRGFVALSIETTPGDTVHTTPAIFSSAAPGMPWVAQAIDLSESAQLFAIDMRDAHNGVAGGLSTGSSSVFPLILLTTDGGATWREAATPDGPANSPILDVVRTRGSGGWAIARRLLESAFLRSVDDGVTWRRASTAFEHDVHLRDLARNTDRE
jgi:photosystem II stability/assembly factor-like uncharacterized protein